MLRWCVTSNPSKDDTWLPTHYLPVLRLTFMTVGCVFNVQNGLLSSVVGHITCLSWSRVDVIPFDTRSRIPFVVAVQSGRRSCRNRLHVRCILQTWSVWCFIAWCLCWMLLSRQGMIVEFVVVCLVRRDERGQYVNHVGESNSETRREDE